jgi:esterase/lipase
MSNQTNQQSTPEVISFIDNFKENNNKDKEKFAEIMENLPEELRENLLNFINEIKNN